MLQQQIFELLNILFLFYLKASNSDNITFRDSIFELEKGIKWLIDKSNEII